MTDVYWSGAADESGSKAGVNCGDFTGRTEAGMAGSVGGSISTFRIPCTIPLPFLCVSGAMSVQKPAVSNSSAYLFMTSGEYASNSSTPDPDVICRQEGIPSNHSLLGPNITYQAVVMMRYRQSLLDMFSAADSIRDLDENIIAPNASLFSNPISRAALRDPFGVTKVDIETDFWTGASTPTGDLSSATNCGDFHNPDRGSKAYIGRLRDGLSFLRRL